MRNGCNLKVFSLEQNKEAANKELSSENKQQKNPSSLTFPLHKAFNNTLNLPVYMLYVGPPQQYPGQEDYYGDQYSHAGQGASEGRRTLQSLGEDVH